jgi:hypothetical protein
MVDEDGFGPTPHQVKMKKKNQAYLDRHLQPIGKNVEVKRHSETICVEFRYFSTPVAGETRNPVPLLYELIKKMFSVAPSIVLKSVNNDTSFISKLEGFPNGFEVEEFFKVGHILEKGDTYAIRVQCERERVKEVSAILSIGICDDAATGTFVPTTAAIGSPDGYMKLVDEHEEYRKNHSYIRISGLHPDLMDAVILDSSDNNTKQLKAGIMGWKENGSNLVISLEPSLNVLDNGEWRVIVKNTNITTAIERLGKITTDAERHKLFSARVNDSESFQNFINITSTTIVDTDTMSYVDGLTGRIDAATAANRRAQRLSNTAPTASIYLFNDSMSAQGQSQTSSIASCNAW